jgi:hypothetical protein
VFHFSLACLPRSFYILDKILLFSIASDALFRSILRHRLDMLSLVSALRSPLINFDTILAISSFGSPPRNTYWARQSTFEYLWLHLYSNPKWFETGFDSFRIAIHWEK